MGRLALLTLLNVSTIGCVTRGPGPFLSEADFTNTGTHASLSEEDVNTLMFKIIAQLGVPQNFLVATNRGDFLVASGNDNAMDLICNEGVNHFEKQLIDDSFAVSMDFDASVCFEQTLNRAPPEHQAKIRMALELHEMRTRLFTRTSCSNLADTNYNELTATEFLREGRTKVCPNHASDKILLNYETSIHAKIIGQPMQTNAQLLISGPAQTECQLKILSDQGINTDGCSIMMRLQSSGGGDLALVVKSKNVRGNLNLPYFTDGYYEVRVNGWVGKVTFGADKNPTWKLSRDDQLAMGEFFGRGIITH